ncbi:hypothetical protein BCR35DRAFT_198412 [Leucosporidium creatinivorum]|uniref:MYND-type domain-containing protein n=1 Tax=Leucosporidium creatinivorum TaxID=106004 RepID=A0A1Y2DMB8_9BASI|nr:hypothetical protein BCR35DRAFT_198412 [Leucosporidium creatinivorum]
MSTKNFAAGGELTLCGACFKGTGPKTATPTLFCSRCRIAAYCGRECQLKHWKEHKLRCKQHVTLDTERQETALSAPMQTRLHDALQHFAASIVYEALFLGARPALALGRPESKTMTHFLELVFAFEPKPDTSNIREQFKLDSATVISFADNLRMHPSAPMQQFVPDGVHRKALRPGLNSVASIMIRGVHVASGSVTSSFIDEASFPEDRYPTELSKTAINTAWKETLAWSLSRPKAPVATQFAVEDVIASETCEGGPEAVLKRLKSLGRFEIARRCRR